MKARLRYNIMAEEKEKTGKAMTKEAIVKSQSSYKGNSQSDLVDIKIVKDGSFYKKGDTDKVHPTTAAILKAKGLIDSYKGEVKTKGDDENA